MPALFGGGKQAPPSWLPQSAEARRRRARETQEGRHRDLGIAAVRDLLGRLEPAHRVGPRLHQGERLQPGRARAGCTNSGKGCHGSETVVHDFNAYHPNAKCTTCHDYQGVGCIPCHKPPQHECELCHDGTMKVAADVGAAHRSLSRAGTTARPPTPRWGPTSSRARTRPPAGKASAHVQRLPLPRPAQGAHRRSRRPRTARTADCRLRRVPQRHPRRTAWPRSLADWKSRRCEDCHTEGVLVADARRDVAAAVEATAALGCGATGTGCHDGNDVHALHPDTPANCSGSGGQGRAGMPQPRGRGGRSRPRRRAASSADGLPLALPERGASRTRRTPRCTRRRRTVPASDASYHGIACGECHFMDADGVQPAERARAVDLGEDAASPTTRAGTATTIRPRPQAIADELARARTPSTRCDDCHGTSGPEARSRRRPARRCTSRTARAAPRRAPGATRRRTSPRSASRRSSANIHTTCLRCHDRTGAGGNQAFDPRSKSCGAGRDCHSGGEYDPCHVRARRSGRSRRRRGRAHTASGARRAGADCVDAASGLEHAVPGLPRRCGSAPSTHGRTRVIAVGQRQRLHPVPQRDRRHGGDREERLVGARVLGARAPRATARRRPAPHGRIDSAHTRHELATDGTVQPGACVRSGCHATTDVRMLHATPGCTVDRVPPARATSTAGTSAAAAASTPTRAATPATRRRAGTAASSPAHEGTELDPSGDPGAGLLRASGCHTSATTSQAARSSGCGVEGCHEAGTTPSMTQLRRTRPGRRLSHRLHRRRSTSSTTAADLTGTVNGVTYGVGENEGCFGCHLRDLRVEHSTRSRGPDHHRRRREQLPRVPLRPRRSGNGAYAGLPAVKAAIANQDHRCIVCHASGSAAPGRAPRRRRTRRSSTATRLPAGYVWADPLEEWQAAFDSPTGGGHNVLLGRSTSGASSQALPGDRRTPRAGRPTRGRCRPTAGTTQWLRIGVYRHASVTHDRGHPGITITCDDCHIVPGRDGGPARQRGQGPRSIRTTARPSTPTRRAARHRSSRRRGTDRVVCFKCHTLDDGLGRRDDRARRQRRARRARRARGLPRRTTRCTTARSASTATCASRTRGATSGC